MFLRDIPRDDWNTFRDRFTRQHRNEPVTLERSDVRDRLHVQSVMTSNGEPKPTPHRDQERPKRQGEDFPGAEKPETDRADRDKDAPQEDDASERWPTTGE